MARQLNRAMVRTLAVALLLVARPLAAQCPNSTEAGDRDLWAANGTVMTKMWYRDMVARSFRMSQDDWDGGWGWVKYNDPNPYRWAFPKMMTAANLMWTGISDAYVAQGAWTTFGQVFPVTALVPGTQFQATSRADTSVDLLYRDRDGRLRHRMLARTPWNAGDTPVVNETNVSDSVATTKADFRFNGEIAVIAQGPDRLHVFARDGKSLLYFALSPNGWAATELTLVMSRTTPIGSIDRYFIASHPVAHLRHGAELHVFARDDFNHLIHYFSEPGASIWHAEDVTQLVGGQDRIQGDPIFTDRESGELDVFALSTAGHLLHYRQASNGSWSVEDVTTGLTSGVRLGGQPSVLSPDGYSLMVVARSTTGAFLVYFWTSLFNWIEWDVTSRTGPIESDPVAVRRRDNRFHVFAQGTTSNQLVHMVMDDEGIRFENVSALLGDYVYRENIGARPLAIASGDRVDVFGPRPGLPQIVHFYWTGGTGWRVENIHAGPNVSGTFDRVTGELAALYRGPSSVHLFSQRLSSPRRAVIFTAPIGLVLNPWHIRYEYYQWAEGSRHDFHYEPTEESGSGAPFATASDGQIEIKCPSLNNRTPVARASTMLHEATHVLYDDFSHQANRGGTNCSDPCSDSWFFHGLREPSGFPSTTTRNHSPNQIQIEFLCDVWEFPDIFLPFTAYNDAKSKADDRMQNRILNPPGWTCGVPRPLP